MYCKTNVIHWQVEVSFKLHISPDMMQLITTQKNNLTIGNCCAAEVSVLSVKHCDPCRNVRQTLKQVKLQIEDRECGNLICMCRSVRVSSSASSLQICMRAQTCAGVCSQTLWCECRCWDCLTSKMLARSSVWGYMLTGCLWWTTIYNKVKL